jgi:hypothetical protein
VLTPVLASIGSLYERVIVDTGKQPEFLFFVAFLVTFGFIRTSAHMIRAQVKWWPGNVEVGGTHIHHLVWGIILLLITGYVAIAMRPPSPWQEIDAIFFGIGTGLTLDEFALWLNLQDVYWTQEGRKSIDAVIVAAAISGIVLIGFAGWIGVAKKVEDVVFTIVGTFGIIAILFAVVNLAKERLISAAVGLFFLPFGVVIAFRLARPHSLWARVFYGDEKRKRAEERFNRHRLHRPHKPEPASGQSAAGSG